MSQAQFSDKISVSLETKTKFSLKMHSILLLVGPDGSNKTEFVNKYLIPKLGDLREELNIQHLDFEKISKSFDQSKYFTPTSIEYKKVYRQAEDILLNYVKNFTEYPVNVDFVIVNAQCISVEFREKILKIAEKNHYNVSAILFDFKNKNDYSYEGQIPFIQIKEFRSAISGQILKKDYVSIDRITSKDFGQYEIELEDFELSKQYHLPYGPEYVIFGDIHGCYEEFISLLKKQGFIISVDKKVTHPEGKKVVLVGDLIDKGYAIKEVIELAYENRDSFYMVVGNHENFVYKALKGIFKKGDIPSQAVVNEYFTTYHMLNEPLEPKVPKEPVDPKDSKLMERYLKVLSEYKSAQNEYLILKSEYDKFMLLSQEEKESRKLLREKFFAVCEVMKNFYTHRNFIVTHAPCEVKFLGKLSIEALRATRDFRYPKEKDYEHSSEFIFALDERIDFLRQESDINHPIHVFGHVMNKNISRHKNKVNVDTGCVAGGKLSCLTVKDNLTIVEDSVTSENNLNIAKYTLIDFFVNTK